MGTPHIPTFGGIVQQSNVTGLLAGIAVYSDNSFVVVGNTASLVQVDLTTVRILPFNGLIIKYSGAAEYQWHRFEDFGELDSLEDVVLDSSSNLYAAGWTMTQSTDKAWGWLFKYDSTGTRQWGKNITITGTNFVKFSGIRVDGSNLIVVGSVVYPNELMRPLIMQLDLDGNVVTSRNGPEGRAHSEIAPTSTAGEHFVSAYGNQVGCMLRMSLSTDIWTECDVSTARRLLGVANLDGTSIAAGTYADNQNPTPRAATVKRSGAGSLSWARTYGPTTNAPYHAWAVTSDASSAYVVARNGSAVTEQNGFASPGVIINYLVNLQATVAIDAVKYAANGDLVWSVSYGDPLLHNVPGDTAVDSYPRLLVAGTRVDPVLLTVTPLVVRYQDI